jgi:hypothetical protein
MSWPASWLEAAVAGFLCGLCYALGHWRGYLQGERASEQRWGLLLTRAYVACQVPPKEPLP